MPILPSVVLPRRMQHRPPPGTRVAPQLLEAAGEAEAALRQLQTSPDGPTGQEAGRRLEEHGPNVVAREQRHGQLSLLTQTLIIHVIRTSRVPFVQSRASWPLLVTTALIRAAGMGLPFSPPGPALGLTPLPARYGPLVALALLCYALLAQLVKTWLARKGWG